MNAAQRPDASSITDDQLDELYADRDRYREEAGALADRVDTLTDIAKSNKRAARDAIEELASTTARLAAVRTTLAEIRAARGVLGNVIADELDAALDGPPHR
ncbi:hypothetical protein ACFVXQ_00090 [Kitasatospora sp. NPDC058263]